jgi:hypothetical protein
MALDYMTRRRVSFRLINPTKSQRVGARGRLGRTIHKGIKTCEMVACNTDGVGSHWPAPVGRAALRQQRQPPDSLRTLFMTVSISHLLQLTGVSFCESRSRRRSVDPQGTF